MKTFLEDMEHMEEVGDFSSPVAPVPPSFDETGCWFRIGEVPHPYSDATLQIRHMRVTRTTPKGVWLDGWRFVLRDARKRYACPTKTEALESYKARKKMQIKILTNQLKHAKEGLDAAEKVTF